jgi:hypothetical protein
VVQADEIGQAHGVTSVATAVGGGTTLVVEAELVTCQLMEYKLGGTSVVLVLTWPSSSSSLVCPRKLGRYPLGQSRHSHGR